MQESMSLNNEPASLPQHISEVRPNTTSPQSGIKSSFLSPRNLHWSSPESGDRWYNSGGSKGTVWSSSEDWWFSLRMRDSNLRGVLRGSRLRPTKSSLLGPWLFWAFQLFQSESYSFQYKTMDPQKCDLVPEEARSSTLDAAEGEG